MDRRLADRDPLLLAPRRLALRRDDALVRARRPEGLRLRRGPLRRRAAAALLAVAPLALAGCGREAAPATRFLGFDPESSAGALLVGWSGFEKTEPGDTFAWAQAREARLRLLAEGPGDRLLRFRAWPLWWEGAPPQTVTVTLNDVRIGTVTLGDGPRVYRVESPAAAWKAGENVVTLSFLWAEAPRDRLPGAADTRTLAVAFDWLEVVPPALPGGTPPARQAGTAGGPGDSRPPGPRRSDPGTPPGARG